MSTEEWKSQRLDSTYVCHTIPAEKAKKGRPHGGFLFGWHKTLPSAPELIQVTECGIFLKVLNPSPWLLVFGYIPPDDSKEVRSPKDRKWKEKAAELFNQIICLSSRFPNTILLGDLNARVGTANSIPLYPRNSRDPKTNANGKPLLSLSAEAGLIICNGRSPGDMEAHYTYVNGANSGCSVVDLVWLPLLRSHQYIP